jgi:hypothetical protein
MAVISADTRHDRTITIERIRGFQPPWRYVQHVDCRQHGRTTWRPNSWTGLRRTPAGHLVGITPRFPGYCPHCQPNYSGKAREE